MQWRSPLQVRYADAITALRNVGEKEAQAQACSELGDVWLHHGGLREATASWTDGLDLITGPYQARPCMHDHAHPKLLFCPHSSGQLRDDAVPCAAPTQAVH